MPTHPYNKRVQKWVNLFLILLFLAALATVPPILFGYASLGWAQTVSSDAQASAEYESAARLLFWRADLFEKAGLRAKADPAGVIRLLSIANLNGTLSPEGRLLLGDAYLATSATRSAIAEWEVLINNTQYTAIAAQRLALQYHARQNYSDEERVLAAWLKSEPNNPQANEMMGRLLAASAAAEALPMLQTASSQSSQAAKRLEQLIAALKTPSQDPAYRLTLSGQALAGLDEWKLAEQTFERATITNSHYASAWAWLGTARQHNQTAGALSALQQAIKLDASSAVLHTMLGNYWQNTGQPQKAIPEFQAAVRIEPDNPAWWLALAGAQSQTDLAEALNAYIKTVNIAPKQAAYWYALAAFCVENNAYVEDYGLNAALMAFALEPKNPDTIDMLGRAQMAVGQWDAAEISFKKAISLGSLASMPRYHLHLGLLYLQNNRQAEAGYEFKQTVLLDSTGAYGSQAKILIERYFPQK
jgi:tetratricopeptide (TPR) repeat protein